MNRDRLLVVVELGSAACLTIGAASIVASAGWIMGGVLGLVFVWRASS
jgi:hypothetical protein